MSCFKSFGLSLFSKRLLFSVLPVVTTWRARRVGGDTVRGVRRRLAANPDALSQRTSRADQLLKRSISFARRQLHATLMRVSPLVGCATALTSGKLFPAGRKRQLPLNVCGGLGRRPA